MPTERRRYQVTETDEIARALDAAAAVWPSEPRSRLIVRTIVSGGEFLELSQRTEQRRAVFQRLKGNYSEDYPVGYLEDLRADWPE